MDATIDQSVLQIERFQIVYASHIYNTMFGVFANFRCEKVDDNTMLIKQIDFLPISYNGPLVVCIEGVKGPDWYPNKTRKEGELKSLEFELQLGVSLDDFHPKIKEPFSISFSDAELAVKRGDYFRIIREIVPVRRPLTNEDQPQEMVDRAFVNGVFDNEHFVRDGLVAAAQKRFQPERKHGMLVEEPVISNPVRELPRTNLDEIAKILKNVELPDATRSELNSLIEEDLAKIEIVGLPSIKCTPGDSRINF